jgi:hypothetical protein
MTPEQRMASWGNLNLESEMGNAFIATCEDAVQMIKDRVQEFGVNAEGVNYRDYTKQYKRFKQGLVKHRPETKNKNNSNKYKGYTDFSFTNRMWTSVGIVSSTAEANEGKVVISAKGTNRDILGYNVDRFGQILDLSDIEIAELQDAYVQRINEVFTHAGL